MQTVILTGGQFGGLEVSITAGQTIIEQADDTGAIWLYEVRPELNGQAIFIGMK